MRAQVAPITDEELARLEAGSDLCSATIAETKALIAAIREARRERDEARALASDLADPVETSRRWYHDSTEWESGDNETGPLWQAIWNRFTWGKVEIVANVEPCLSG